jgi:hypothetical protein
MNDFLSSARQQLISQVSGANISTSNSAPIQAPQILDVWRDPIWQSLGVIIGAVLALVAILISLRQWQRKSLVYEVISKENIVRIADHSIGSDLQISYQGKPINDLYLITVKFINSGNTEIRPEDYIRKIILSFGEHSEILSNKILEQEPNNLDVKINHDKSQEALLIDPVLLNKKDCFTVQSLVTGFQSIKLNGRIAGVTQIREFTPLKIDSENIVIFSALTTVVGALFGSFLTVKTSFSSSENPISISSLLLVMMSTLVVAYLVNQLPSFTSKNK